MKPVRSSEDLKVVLQNAGIDASLIRMEVETMSVEAAARALSVDAERIIKTVLFFVGQKPVLALGNGRERIDRGAIAAHFEVPKRAVRLASPSQVQEVTGYEVGAVPPIGHPSHLPTLCDQRLYSFERVYAGGGSTHAMLWIKTVDLLRLSEAVDIALMQRPSPERR